jgi:hypothetical protein
MDYYQKYKKYKTKYLQLQQQLGGDSPTAPIAAPTTAPVAVPPTEPKKSKVSAFFAKAKTHATDAKNKATAAIKKHTAKAFDTIDEMKRLTSSFCRDSENYQYLINDLIKNYPFNKYINYGFVYSIKQDIRDADMAEAMKKHKEDHIAKKSTDKNYKLSENCIKVYISMYFGQGLNDYLRNLEDDE